MNNEIIISVWIWALDKEGITCVWKKESDSYFIRNIRFWETRPDWKWNKYDWPLHLTQKTWLKLNDIEDFIKILQFWQNHFENLKPEWKEKLSWDETIKATYELIESKKNLKSIYSELTWKNKD